MGCWYLSNFFFLSVRGLKGKTQFSMALILHQLVLHEIILWYKELHCHLLLWSCVMFCSLGSLINPFSSARL